MQEEQNNYVGLIITLLFMLLYFFAGSSKKKSAAQKNKESAPASFPLKKSVKPPPIKAAREEAATALPSYYEAARISGAPAVPSEPSFASAIAQGLSMQVDLDPAYKIRQTKAKSFARKTLLQNQSLKDLIVIEAILKRPYE